MHPCPRLAKRPVQRRKAAISLLGEREFYEDFEDFFFNSSRYNLFVTPQGTTEMEPSLTPVIYTQRATRRVPENSPFCCNNQF